MFRMYLGLAKASIRRNRTRSFLTCLGVAIGVASLVLILSLTGSLRMLITDEVGELGDNLVVISNNLAGVDLIKTLKNDNGFLTSNLNFGDAEMIREVKNVAAVAPVSLGAKMVKSDKNTLETVEILGTNADFAEIWGLHVRYGTFLNDMNENTVVVGHRLALTLFNMDNPVGKSLEVWGEKAVVMGVLSAVGETENLDNVDFDNTLIIGTKLAEKIGMQVRQIEVTAAATGDMEEMVNEIETRFREAKGGDGNFEVMHGEEISYPANTELKKVSIALATTAGVALVVGGIGIMNIMLLSVAERTREIGVRKAVGATSGDILMQFLLEALMLSMMGVVMGVILGYVLAFFVSIATALTPYFDLTILIMVLVVAVVTGVLFGIYPAAKAACKSPIEYLK